ncbi:MAG: hypothetical protein RI947_1128 [Candidatus Parcubacteria bacterium]|jgi:hypothetical protein
MTTKQQQWDLTREKFKKVTDKLGCNIDDGILETVIALNVLGFRTTQSCEGHLDRAVAAPWIDIEPRTTKDWENLWIESDKAFFASKKLQEQNGPKPEIKALFDKSKDLLKKARKPTIELAQRLMNILDDYYRNRYVAYDKRITITRMHRGARVESIGAYTQDINTQLVKKQKLKEYQDEMRSFTEFLKRMYFSE